MFMRFYEPKIAAKLWVLKQCQEEKNLTRLIHIQRAKKICVFLLPYFRFVSNIRVDGKMTDLWKWNERKDKCMEIDRRDSRFSIFVRNFCRFINWNWEKWENWQNIWFAFDFHSSIINVFFCYSRSNSPCGIRIYIWYDCNLVSLLSFLQFQENFHFYFYLSSALKNWKSTQNQTHPKLLIIKGRRF